MNLSNRVLKDKIEKEYYILSGKKLDKNKYIYLLNPLGTEPDFSLWNIDFIDNDNKIINMNDHSYMKNLKKLDITKKLPGHDGEKFSFLAGKEIDFNNRSLWILGSDIEPKYSLWIVEPTEEGGFDLWSYECPDDEALKLTKELLEDFTEHAFD